MSKLTELRAELVILAEQVALLLKGGEDSLDSNTGQSIFTEPAFLAQSAALANLQSQHSWINDIIRIIDSGISNGFDSIKTYDVTLDVINELGLKSYQIMLFQSLFMSEPELVIGADKIVIEQI